MFTQQLNDILPFLPADGHSDDNWLPAGVEQLSGGGNLPSNQHPERAQGHKDSTHQWVGIVVVLCMGGKEGGFTQINMCRC